MTNNTGFSLTRFAWLSMAAAVATIVLKTAAYLVTGSVGLLSDALESLVNLVGAFMALSMLTIQRGPRTKTMPTATARRSIFQAESRAR